MDRCRICYCPTDASHENCSVCGVVKGKDIKDLTKEEKLLRYFCRGIKVAGFLSIIGGILTLIMTGSMIISQIRALSGIQLVYGCVFSGLLMVWGIAGIIIGTALRQYKRWSFYGGVATYGISVVIGTLTLNPVSALFGILLLYYIANATSRKILLR